MRSAAVSQQHDQIVTARSGLGDEAVDDDCRKYTEHEEVAFNARFTQKERRSSLDSCV
jgi:hypothetical protein